ncbi:MAG: hypothetical protein M3Y32_11615 [Pseudomonadota bacterium]|nr:hypothetical protein [Pseudomonadota bacterium]
MQPMTNGPATAPAFADSQSSQRPALSLSLGSRAEILYEPRQWRPQDVIGGGYRNADGAARLSLQFKSPRRNPPRNLLRVQLSGGGVMLFKPGGGGLTVRYQAQF